MSDINDVISAWIDYQIREARRRAHGSDRTAEHALLRSMPYLVNAVQRLFPVASVGRLLRHELLATFDALPEAEKGPLPDDRGWDEPMRAWVRERLGGLRTKATQEKQPWYPSLTLDMKLLDEARARFPTGDVVGLIFEHAWTGFLDPAVQRAERAYRWMADRARSSAWLRRDKGAEAEKAFLAEMADAFAQEVGGEMPAGLVELMAVVGHIEEERDTAEAELHQLVAVQWRWRERLTELRQRHREVEEELRRKLEEAPGNVGAWWQEKLQEMKSGTNTED